jgi:hypothetical protein
MICSLGGTSSSPPPVGIGSGAYFTLFVFSSIPVAPGVCTQNTIFRNVEGVINVRIGLFFLSTHDGGGNPLHFSLHAPGSRWRHVVSRSSR